MQSPTPQSPDDVVAPEAKFSLPEPTAPPTRREMRERERADALANATVLPPAAEVSPDAPTAPEASVEPGSAQRAAAERAVAQLAAAQLAVAQLAVSQRAALPRAQSSVSAQEAAPVVTTPPAVGTAQPAGTQSAAAAAQKSTAPGEVAEPARSVTSGAAPSARVFLPRSAAFARPPRDPVRGRGRRLVSRFATFGAMLGVGLMLIATTVPATAFARPDSTLLSSGMAAQSSLETQDLDVDATASPIVLRDDYTIVAKPKPGTSYAGSGSYSYTNDPNGTVQWPLPTGTRMSSGFGVRHVANCSFCSTVHQGLDFNPGAGAPISSIAGGVVSLAENASGGLGSHVIVDHVIDGKKVQSVYGHMRYGSILVARGQTVTVGQQLGSVGSTGASTGPHLHFEVHLGGVPVDPYAWLQANAN